MKKIIARLGENQRVIFYTSLVGVVGLILSIPLCFFGHHDILLGWCLGIIISILSFIVLCKQSDVILFNRSKWLFVLFYILRFTLYIVGLVLALFLSKLEINLFNVFAVFIGYIPIKIVIICIGGR